jgi:hypothetical protein
MAFIFLQIQRSSICKFPRQIKSLRVFQRGLDTNAAYRRFSAEISRNTCSIRGMVRVTQASSAKNG